MPRIIINVGWDFARRSNKTLLSRLRTKRYSDAMRGGERERRGESTSDVLQSQNLYIYRASDGAERKVNGKLEKYSTTEFCELVYS